MQATKTVLVFVIVAVGEREENKKGSFWFPYFSAELECIYTIAIIEEEQLSHEESFHYEGA